MASKKIHLSIKEAEVKFIRIYFFRISDMKCICRRKSYDDKYTLFLTYIHIIIFSIFSSAQNVFISFKEIQKIQNSQKGKMSLFYIQVNILFQQYFKFGHVIKRMLLN